MATREEVRESVQGLLGSDPHISDAQINTLVTLRFELEYEKFTWSRRLRDFTITLVAQESSTDGEELTVTNGDDTVSITDSATPFDSTMDGRQIVVEGINQYFFVGFVSTSSLNLEDGEDSTVEWPGSTSTEASWRIFQTIYTLPSDADEVISLAGEFPMDEYDGGRDALDRTDPDRTVTEDHPRYWMYAGENSSGVREIEVWPVPSQARILRGQYARKAPTLSDSTEIGMNRAFLVFSVAADAMNMLYAKTGDQSYKDLGLFYERKSQEVEKDVKFKEIGKLSLPKHLARGGPRRLGGDYHVSHLDEEP